MSEYSVLVPEPTATLDGLLETTVQLQVSDDGGQTWQNVKKATKDIAISAVDIVAVLNNETLTDDEKRDHIDQIVNSLVDWSINMSGEAIDGMGQLYGGWPIRIPLQ